MSFSDAVDTTALCLGFTGALVLLRTLFVIAYLPIHLSLNRKGVPMEARAEGMSWVGPASILLFIGVAILMVVLLNG